MNKKAILLNLLIVLLVVLLGGLVFCNEKVGYGNMALKVEKMTPTFDDYRFAPDTEDIWNFMHNATNAELDLLENEEIDEEVNEDFLK